MRQGRASPLADGPSVDEAEATLVAMRVAGRSDVEIATIVGTTTASIYSLLAALAKRATKTAPVTAIERLM